MKNVKFATVIFMYIMSTTACQKFVEVDPPKTRLSSKTVFESDETATAATLGIYTYMNSSTTQFSYNITLFCALGSDELTTYNTDPSSIQLYKNGLTPLQSPTNVIWNYGYSIVYQANAVIEGLNNSKFVSEPVKKQLEGEALFIRAFSLFYLTNFFGDIPYPKTTDYSINAIIEKRSQKQIYDTLILDLKTAKEYLNENYIATNSIDVSSERIRPNKFAAAALLARIYLYTNNYDLAEKEATSILSQTVMYDTTAINDVFLKNSHEAIWQLIMPQPSYTNANTTEGTNFILMGKPSVGTGNSNSIQPKFYADFETGDKRLSNWIGSVTDTNAVPNETYYYPYKYKVASSPTISEYCMVLRLGEQYLIRAEARTMLGNLSGGIEDIDVIKNRAGLPMLKNLNPSIDKSALLDKIAHERKAELFCEWGHRWLDLKRTGKIDTVMSAFAPIKGSSWSSFRQLWPIPQTERNINPKLTQNPGYSQ